MFPSGSLLMAVHDKLPIKTPADYIEYARKNKATFGTYAPASFPHMIADTFGRTRGIDVEPVHYKGEAPMWIDVASGQVTAGAPEEIQRKVSDAIVEGYSTPKLRQLHETFGITNGPPALDETRKRWKDEGPQWIASADRLGVKLD